MSVDIVSRTAAHGGQQLVAKHTSRSTGTEMTFAVYLPPQAADGPVPVLWYLSGLTLHTLHRMGSCEYREWEKRRPTYTLTSRCPHSSYATLYASVRRDSDCAGGR